MQPKMHNPQTPYTWTDYQTWPEGERWEIIGGVAYNMSPAPSTKHQTVIGNFFGILHQKLAGKICRPFIAPTDVKLSDVDVVQPDILVVCDPGKITPTHIEGPPDLIVEVLSPSTSPKDLREKKALYERTGVQEYVVVDPLENYANRFLLGDTGGFDKGTVFGPQETLTLAKLEGIEIPLWEVFEVAGPEDKPTNGVPAA